MDVGLFLSACVAAVNFPYTVLLAVTLLYWLSVILGVFNLDLFGSGEGEAVDLIGEIDAGGGGNVGTDAGTGFFDAVPQFLSLGGAPVDIFFSFFSLSAWAISMAVNHALGNTSILLALGMAVPIILASLFVARIASVPFGSLFRFLAREHEQHEKVVGKTCMISTQRADSGFGQAEVETSGAPLILNVRTTEGVTMRKGESALVIRFDREKHLYIIRPYSSQSPAIEDKTEKP